jgi:putative membrane protein
MPEDKEKVMYRDFLTVMLMNITAGFLLLAHFAWKGLKARDGAAVTTKTDGSGTRSPADLPDFSGWTPGFALVGSIAVLTGAVMMFTWPLPGSNNVPFGESSFLLGGVFVATAFAFGRRRGLQSLAVFAFLAGAVAIVLGARIVDLGMTQRPVVSGIGFMLSGLAAVLASAALTCKPVRSNVVFRLALGAVAAAAAVIWAITAFDGYWGHLADFSTWKPQ